MFLVYNITKGCDVMENKLEKINIEIKSIAIFRNLLTQPIFIRLQHLLSKSQEKSIQEYVDAIASFANEIYENGSNLSNIIFRLTMEDENAYIKSKAMNEEMNEHIENALQSELLILQKVACLQLNDFCDEKFDFSIVNLPSWSVTNYDFKNEYDQLMKRLHQCGYGIYAKYHMFTLHEEEIVPIKYPDMQKLSDFSDYEKERTLLIKNTLALLNGSVASNTLLYGDAGTGKSSSIKAIVNEYKKDGLRLIEVKKQQLFQIPYIIETLSRNPLKFIIFIDDLSFASNDENFAALKSILEGSVSSVGNNIVIYATSNRRHLLKEDHQARLGDEVHLNDTLQETMSLSSRFGLIITYNRPEKDIYLHIVSELAKQYDVLITDELFKKAEAYAIRHHGRSPRTAKQFIELMKAGI